MCLRNAVAMPLFEINEAFLTMFDCLVRRAVSLHAFVWPRAAKMLPTSGWRCPGAMIDSKAREHVFGVQLPNGQRNPFLRPDACADVRQQRRLITVHR